MLTPEQETILSNIKSLVQQIENIEGAQSDTDEETNMESPVQKGKGIMKTKKQTVRKEEDDYTDVDVAEDEEVEMEMDEEYSEEDVMKAMKVLATVFKAENDEGTTANSDADSRLEDDQPEESSSNVDEVAKAMFKKLMSGTPRKKVVKSQDTELKGAILGLTRVVKKVAMDQKEQGQAMTSVLEGLGIASEVKKSMKQKREIRKSRTPRRDSEMGEILNELKKMNGSDKVEKSIDTSVSGTRKALRGSLTTLLTP